MRLLRRNYLRDFPRCQYTVACGAHVSFGSHPATETCVEHIWNRRGPGSEHWSNYASVCPAAHDWKHANSVEGRVAIMHYKMFLARQTGDADHFDINAINAAAGKNVAGWVESKMDSLPEWCKDKALLLLREIWRLP